MNEEFDDIGRRLFEKTGNPLFVWSEYQQAREAKAAIPDWVLQYLDEAATALFALADECEEKATTGISNRIAAAFGLVSKGRGTAFSDFHSRWVEHAFAVDHLIDEGCKEYLAIEGVAEEFGVSNATVRRSFKLYESIRRE